MHDQNLIFPLLQSHLVPTDSPDSLDMDEFVNDDHSQFTRQFRERQIRQVRTNEALRQRLLDIAEEADRLGTF